MGNLLLSKLSENSIKDLDYIECPICSQRFIRMSWKHLRKHGYMSSKEFILVYPNQLMESPAYRNHMAVKNKEKSPPNKGKKMEEYMGEFAAKEMKEKWSTIRKGVIPVNKNIDLVTQHGEIRANEIKNKQRIARAHRPQVDMYVNKYGMEVGLDKYLQYIQNMKNSLVGREGKNLGKTFEEIFGEEMAAEIKLKLKKASSERFISPQTRYKHRERAIKNREDNGGVINGYNKKTIPIFKKFDEINNTLGQYAKNPKEFKIYGYFLDYINFEFKLIIEVDEQHHYTGRGLRPRDVIRQEEICRLLPDYKFLRFRDTHMEDILKIDGTNMGRYTVPKQLLLF